MLWSQIRDRVTEWLWSRCVPIGWRDHRRHSTTLGYDHGYRGCCRRSATITNLWSGHR